MKAKLLLFVFLTPLFIFSQTQIGSDIDGEAAKDESGEALSLSSDGSIVAIGARQNDGNGDWAGHVRVYENISGVWTQIGTDIDGQAAGDDSGQSVSLSSDGSIVAIGAPRGNYTRIYKNNAGVWTQVGGNIVGEASGDESGWSVSLSSDGSVVAIGARANEGNGDRAGHVRIYKNLSGVWTQIGADIDGEAVNDQSGYSVSLSSDGDIVAIGARENDGNGDGAGHVRVYENLSGTWNQIGADIDGEAAGDESGSSISLSSDGNILAIGAYSNDGNGNNSGHVRVYENLLGTWTQIGADIDGEEAEDRLGSNNGVSLSSDGSILAAGADNNSGNGIESGHVRIFKNISGVWTQIGEDIDGEAAEDNFGNGVRLSEDGFIVAIGAENNDGNGEDSGHVRVYDLSSLLSLEDNEIAKNFSIYPNPASETLNLSFNASLELKKVKIYNVLGQPIFESTEKSFDISSLSTGVYYVEITTNEGKGVKKLMVK